MYNLLFLFFVLFFASCTSTDNKSNPNIHNQIYQTAIRFSNDKNWVYDAAYYSIPYPKGDIPSGGACTDVIIRVLREYDLDLQQLIHEDMSQNFDTYPKLWGLRKPDPNIDHRRVPNIMCYFKRQGYDLPVSQDRNDYIPGDIVTWELPGKLTHIGICLENGDVYHNIGPYAKIDQDFLFRYKIIGHYRL
jgi:uncharacterized protein YijF (DUF1287 family)